MKRIPLSKPSWWWSAAVIVVFCSLMFGFILRSQSRDQMRPTMAPTAEVVFDISVLQDLDRGDLVEARRKLNDDCMVRVFTIIEAVNFSTNKDVLSAQAGLRAAARYWRGKQLPTNLLVFDMSEPIQSNTVYQALTIVRGELDRGARRTGMPRTDK